MSRSINFVLAFTQADLGVDVLPNIPIGMVVDRNRGEWAIDLEKHFTVSSKWVPIGFNFKNR